jgi:protein kinase-like protein
LAEASGRPKQLPNLEQGSVFAGYRIESLLARGGMGVVYKARDVDLDRTVALKIIAPEHTQDETAVARFKSEARIAASLEHPNIVPIHRGGEFEGVLYLAMRFVPGTNLREIIDRAPMALHRVARILTDVARALDVAHARGLVHRDVKPANILLSGDEDNEQVYLTDFGLTKRLGSHGDLTRPGGWVGTPDYVAPEQIQARDVDGRADIYSLGCVLYEMLTGHVAYAKGSDVAKLWAHVSDPPPLPSADRPNLVKSFDEAVARATAKDPDDRYSTASELAAAVRAAVAEQEQADRARGADARGAAEDDPRALTRESYPAAREDMFIGGAEPPGPAPPGPPPRVAGPPPAAVSPAAAVTPGHGAGPAEADRSSGDGTFRRYRWPMLAAAALLLCGVAAVLLLGSGSSSKSKTTAATKSEPAPAGDRRSGKLVPVPTNRVTADGSAVLRLNGNVATVSVTTNKLLDGAAHAIHIHAGGKGRCPTPAASAIHNGHRSIATLAGVPFYGKPVTSLTLRGDTSSKSILAFNRFPKTGEIRYSRKIKVGPVVASYIRENNAVLVVHGIDYNHNGLYDGTLDRSDLNRSIPGEATAPGLCGPLKGAAAKKAAAKSKTSKRDNSKTTGEVQTRRGQVFTASLTTDPASAGAQRSPSRTAPAWQCVLPGPADLRQA